MYRLLAEAAEVPVITSHGARHTTASSHAHAGASQMMIALLVGHAETSATERYTRIQTEATKSWVQARCVRLGSASS